MRTGIVIDLITPERYRAELVSWNREASTSGDPAEVLSESQIEAEVRSRAGFLDLAVTPFAEMPDGTRIVGTAASVEFAGGGVFETDDPSSPEPTLRPDDGSAILHWLGDLASVGW